MNFYLARLSPDGALILEGAPVNAHKMGLYRMDLQGGAPQLLFYPEGFVPFGCTGKAGNLCVFGQPSADKNELVIAAFDPLGGPRKELVRIPLQAGTSADIGFDYSWQISPDGSWIGIVKKHGQEIRLVPLRRGETRTVSVRGYRDLIDLNWATDSKGMFVSAQNFDGATLLHVALTGNAQSVWHQSQSTATWGFPSPDGRHLAILGANSESNAWIISNFSNR
jgi:hypothetical protein